MRRGLLWVLGGTVLASVAALVLQRPVATVVQAVDTVHNARGFRGSPDAEPALIAKPPLPAKMPRWDIEPAKRDPFSEAPTAVAPALPAAPPVAKAPPPAPPPPAPPPMVWRYMGVMDAPGGKRLVMLGRENDAQAVIVETGTRLDDGYEVLAVGNEAIRLFYPPLHHEVVIAIPPPPSSDR